VIKRVTNKNIKKGTKVEKRRTRGTKRKY